MVGKENSVMSVFHIQAASMELVTNHGNVTAKKDGVDFTAIKVNLISTNVHKLSKQQWICRMFSA